MKRGLLCAAATVVLLVFGAWGLVSLRIYPAENVVEKDHVRIYLRRDGREAFASVYFLDVTGYAFYYTIPDTVQGARVTAIGGLVGELKKVPCNGLYVAMPETYRGAERAQYTMPVNAVEVTLPVHIHIGRYVRSIEPDYSLPTPTGYFGYEAGVRSYILAPVWSVTCDENNETYYAEGGKLYLRAAGTLEVLTSGEA